MANANRAFDETPSTPVPKAFLVVRRGGRWTDLLRLSPDRTAVIGRASTNQIVIRSHQASRQHAEIRWDEGQWWVRDLASRNGTVVDGQRIAAAQPLRDGGCIEVAGCAMTFVTSVADALDCTGAANRSGARLRAAPALTDNHLTLDGSGSDAIVHRSMHSRFLDLTSSHSSSGELPASDAWQSLFSLAYRLATADSLDVAAQTTIDMLTATLPNSAGGVFLPQRNRTDGDGETVAKSPSLIAFVSSDDRSYRPPATAIVESVVTSGSAVIARNMIDDTELQDADSRGEYSTTTAIIAPIRFRETNEQAAARNGYLHLYSTDTTTEYSATELDLAIAAAGVLAAAIENIRTRGQLTHSLRHTRKQVEVLRERLAESVHIVGDSAAIKQVKSLIARVAPTDTTVLIRGESGVGKELVAAAIHHHSPRCDAPLVCLNCAALSPSLLESELFGHEKGAFTGATDQKKGKFEAADGGTLMLDEIGEMHIDLQAKLLRVLEGHPFERLGGQQSVKVNVRLIAATNRDLPQQVQQGLFRSDLYYRLNVVEIMVPALRERRDDILLIANHYLNHFSNKTARRVDGFTHRAAALLAVHPWPGNIRELKNVIERAVVLGGDSIIDIDDLHIKPQDLLVEPTTDLGVATTSVASVTKMQTLDEIEQLHLIAVLSEVGGNKSRAAMLLGIERSTLDRKLKRFGIKPTDYK